MGTPLRPPSLSGLIQAGSAFVVVSTILGHAGRFNWFLDLFAHFRIQYFIILSAAVLLHLMWRKWGWAIFFAIFAVWNACLLLPFYFHERSETHLADPCTVRVLVLNVHTASTAYD